MRAITAAAIVVGATMAACDKGPSTRTGPPNHAMMGFIDRPAAGSTVGPVFLVAGWAVGRDGIDRVRIYLDDELMATAPVNIARPDIDRTYPRYASTGPLHGFNATIDAGSRSGFRTLRIEAIDKSRAKAHVASTNVKIEP